MDRIFKQLDIFYDRFADRSSRAMGSPLSFTILSIFILVCGALTFVNQQLWLLILTGVLSAQASLTAVLILNTQHRADDVMREQINSLYQEIVVVKKEQRIIADPSIPNETIFTKK